MELESRLRTFLLPRPKLGPDCFVAPGAVLVGDVTLGPHASVWFNAVLRADLNRIVIGPYTNIQDNCVLHLADELPCVVGEYVTVGHGAIVHACKVGDGALVGMGAAILDGAVIGAESLVGARSLVTQGMEIPAGSLVLGSPAEIVRALTAEERRGLRDVAEKYARMSAFYRENVERWQPGSGPKGAGR